MRRIMIGLGIVAGIAVTLINGSAFTASNNVPASRLANVSQPITANTLKPGQCASLNLTAILAGSGNLNGTGAAELILGGPAAQTIKGNGGNDCIIGGGGADTLQGGSGTDVCIGSTLATFNKDCEQTVIQ